VDSALPDSVLSPFKETVMSISSVKVDLNVSLDHKACCVSSIRVV
jgi:hypothetical protein